MLSDEEIQKAGKDLFWPLDEDAPAFARAIESAATAPLLARSAELERELEAARKEQP